jgi:hypothetical protein
MRDDPHGVGSGGAFTTPGGIRAHGATSPAAAAAAARGARGGGVAARPASALAPKNSKATRKLLVGTEIPQPGGSGASGGSHGHVAAYTELVAARTRKCAASAHAAYHAGGALPWGKAELMTSRRKVRVPGAVRDASVSAPLAFNLRNAALVYSGVDIMVGNGGERHAADLLATPSLGRSGCDCVDAPRQFQPRPSKLRGGDRDCASVVVDLVGG